MDEIHVSFKIQSIFSTIQSRNRLDAEIFCGFHCIICCHKGKDHEVKINIEFAPISQLLVQVPATSGGTVTVTGGSMGYSSLYVDYIYLDTDERRRFAQVSHEYLIEQLQFTGGESYSASANKIRLNFNHPVKELIWVVQPDANVAANQWDNYTVLVNGVVTNPVVDAKLQLNGHDRFSTRLGAYFNLVQPYQSHCNIPKSRGVNVYSFALTPEQHQPSGTCNFSRIDNATLQLDLLPNIGTGQVRIYAPNYNVLRIMSGMGIRKSAHESRNIRLVISMIATIPNCWKLFRAHHRKSDEKSVKTDGIRRSAAKLLDSCPTSMKKVQRLDGIGSSRDGLRYSPILTRKMRFTFWALDVRRASKSYADPRSETFVWLVKFARYPRSWKVLRARLDQASFRKIDVARNHLGMVKPKRDWMISLSAPNSHMTHGAASQTERVSPLSREVKVQSAWYGNISDYQCVLKLSFNLKIRKNLEKQILFPFVYSQSSFGIKYVG